jgi:hypothetical protein
MEGSDWSSKKERVCRGMGTKVYFPQTLLGFDLYPSISAFFTAFRVFEMSTQVFFSTSLKAQRTLGGSAVLVLVRFW